MGAAPSNLLTFDEALAVGEALHDRFVKMLGAAPMPKDDLGWGDVVQFCQQAMADQLAARAARLAEGDVSRG